MKNLKKAIVIVSCIVIVVSVIMIIIKRNNMNVNEQKEISEVVPDVNENNTKIAVSIKKDTDDETTGAEELENPEQPVESRLISVQEKENAYNLFYYIEPTEITEEKTETAEQVNEEEIENDLYIKYEEEIEIFSNSKIYFKYELNGDYSKIPYIVEISDLIVNESVVSESTDESEEKNNENKGVRQGGTPYYVVINSTTNVITVYGKDDDGNYTVPVKAIVCSTGRATPRTGVYKLTNNRWRWKGLFGNVYGQYTVQICGNILFHSVPYLTKGDQSSLEYWEYDKLGTSASAGCIRLKVIDAIWIYYNCGSGTKVEFTTNGSDPLGKPSAMKISEYTEYRGWDPTDPDENNPWNNRKEENKQDNNPTTNNNADENKDNDIGNKEEEINNTIENNIPDNTEEINNIIVNNTTIDNIIDNSANEMINGIL